MDTIEVMISDIIIQHPEINSFNQLLEAVRGITSNDMLFLNFDVKPDYRDTLRIRIREGNRFTTLDIDADTAARWATVMSTWAGNSH